MKRTLWTISAILLVTSLILAGCKGKEGPAGAPGTSYTPPAPLCSSPTKYGLTTTPVLGGYTAQTLRCSRITLATAGTAINLSMYVSGATPTGQVRMGIYNDNVGYPGNLMVETDTVNLMASSWNTVGLPYNLYLPAGTYWLVHLISSANDLAYDPTVTAGSQVYLFGYGWAALPKIFPAAATVGSQPYCINVGVCP